MADLLRFLVCIPVYAVMCMASFFAACFEWVAEQCEHIVGIS